MSEWPREIGRKRERKASLLGGVTRSRRASPRPAQGLFPFISHASPSQAANNQLTQLAMEHSPKTLPISTTSQEERMPTRWSQHLLSPFPAYLLTTTHFRRRAHPAPPPASLPSRPGPGRGGHRAGEGIVLGSAPAALDFYPVSFRDSSSNSGGKKRLVFPLSHLFFPPLMFSIHSWSPLISTHLAASNSITVCGCNMLMSCPVKMLQEVTS